MKNPKIKLRNKSFYKHIENNKILENAFNQGGAKLVHRKVQNIAERN